MCRQCLDKRTDLRDLVQHLRFAQQSGHVARQCRLEQVKSVPLAPGAVCGALPVELAHRLKQALLVRKSGGDGVLDIGDCCAQLLAGLFKKVGHGLLLMLNRIRSSPSPFGEAEVFYGEVFSSEELPTCRMKSLDCLVANTNPLECAFAPDPDLLCDCVCLSFVRKAGGHPLPFRTNSSPAPLNGRPAKQIGLNPEVIVARDVAGRVYCLPMPRLVLRRLHLKPVAEG